MRHAIARTTRLALLVGIATAAACGGADSTAPSGRPASLSKSDDADNQIAVVGTAVIHAPSVLVVDAAGKPVGGVRVTFAVTAGGGTIGGALQTSGGADTTTIVTSSTGVATVGSWTLGAAAGENRVRAAVTGLAPAEFVAVGTDACKFASPLPLGVTVTGALTPKDCDDGSFFYDFHRTTVVTGSAVLFTMASTAFDTYLELTDEAGNYIALNDDRDSTHAGIKAILRTNDYIAFATSFQEHATGPYTISVAATNPSIEHCEDAWVSVGVTTTQTVTPSDCASAHGFYSDKLLVILNKGQTVTVTMSSTEFDTYLEFADVSGALVAWDDNSNGGTNSRFVFTSPITAAYYLIASTANVGETGAYTLSIQ